MTGLVLQLNWRYIVYPFLSLSPITSMVPKSYEHPSRKASSPEGFVSRGPAEIVQGCARVASILGSFSGHRFLYSRRPTAVPSRKPLQTLRLQIAQRRSYLCTLGPKVGIIYILGALGRGNHFDIQSFDNPCMVTRRWLSRYILPI